MNWVVTKGCFLFSKKPIFKLIYQHCKNLPYKNDYGMHNLGIHSCTPPVLLVIKLVQQRTKNLKDVCV